MIKVGLNIKWRNSAGAEANEKYLFDAADIHEAAVETLKASWSSPWQGQSVKNGEFHDTDTMNTWSVDSRGHTKRDYRKEKTEAFEKRWRLRD